MLEHSLTIQWLVASGVIHIGGFPSPQIILEDAQPDVDHLPRQMPSTGVGEHCARVQTGATLIYQLLRNDGCFSGPKNLLASLKGAPRPCPFRQHNGGSPYKSAGSWSHVTVPLQMARRLLLWAQCNLSSLRAVHLLGRLNKGADMLSRGSVSPGEWRLYPQVVQACLRLRKHFSRSEMLWPTTGPALVCMPSLQLPCSLRSSDGSGW